MKFYSFLLLLIITFIIGCKSSAVVTVKLHDSAGLPCTKSCSGSVKWFVSDDLNDPLAECDQDSCRSVKDGYQMNYNQYLKGDFSLIIPKADFSHRDAYKSRCVRADLCKVVLQVTALRSTVPINPGESLVMKVDVSDAVEVIYSRTEEAGASSVQICTVDGSSLQCKPEYKPRISLISSDLKVRDMNITDGGVYIIRNIITKDDIHIYTVVFSALGSTVRRRVGESLVMKLNVSDPVEVIYSRTYGASSDQICTVRGSSLQCKPEYNHRISLISSDLVLRDMKASESGVYTIQDNSNKDDIHFYTVIVQALRSTVQRKAGESLVMNLDRSDSVEVIYSRTEKAGESRDQICTVRGSSLQCKPEYNHRASLNSTSLNSTSLNSSDLVLSDMKKSESGVYIIRNIRTKDHIHIYTVIVQEKPPLQWWVIALIVLVVLLLLMIYYKRVEKLKRAQVDEEIQKVMRSVVDLGLKLNEFEKQKQQLQESGADLEKISRVNNEILRLNLEIDSQREKFFKLMKQRRILSGKEGMKEKYLLIFCPCVSRRRHKDQRVNDLSDEEEKLKLLLEKENHENTETESERKRITERLERIRDEKNLCYEEEKLKVSLKELSNEFYEDMKTDSGRKWMKERLTRINEQLERIIRLKLLWDEEKELKQWLKEKENHKDMETEAERKQKTERLKRIKEDLERIKEDLERLTDVSERLKLLWDEEKKLNLWLKEKENHKDMKTEAEREQIKERLKRIKEDLETITDDSDRVKLSHDEDLERLSEMNNAAGDEEREKLMGKSEKIHFEDEQRRRNMELEEIAEDVL